MEKNTGSETGRVLFLYTPAAAGGYVEELLRRRRPLSDAERNELREQLPLGSRRSQHPLSDQ